MDKMNKFVVLHLCFIFMKAIGETFSTGVTPFVNGSVISGEIIHPIAYFKALSTSLTSTHGDQASTMISHTVGEHLEKIIDEVEKSPKPSDEEGSDEEPDTIYLRNVEIWNPPNSMKGKNSLLVLRLDSIDGVIWGLPSRDASEKNIA